MRTSGPLGNTGFDTPVELKNPFAGPIGGIGCVKNPFAGPIGGKKLLV
jgi:hypothetical protein